MVRFVTVGGAVVCPSCQTLGPTSEAECNAIPVRVSVAAKSSHLCFAAAPAKAVREAQPTNHRGASSSWFPALRRAVRLRGQRALYSARKRNLWCRLQGCAIEQGPQTEKPSTGRCHAPATSAPSPLRFGTYSLGPALSCVRAHAHVQRHVYAPCMFSSTFTYPPAEYGRLKYRRPCRVRHRLVPPARSARH